MGVVIVHVRDHPRLRARGVVIRRRGVGVEDAEIVENIRRGVVGIDDYGFALVVELYRFYLGWTNGREGSVLRHVVVRELELDDALPGVSRVFGSGHERVFVGNAMDERSVE